MTAAGMTAAGMTAAGMTGTVVTGTVVTGTRCWAGLRNSAIFHHQEIFFSR